MPPRRPDRSSRTRSSRARPTRTRLAALAGTGLLASGCGLAGGGTGTDAERAGGSDHYPVTVDNCGTAVTFDAAPSRAVLLKSAAVPYLAALGALDAVQARAGQYPDAYYDAATRADLADIDLLTDETDASGHLQISPEVVVGLEPDLVLGETDNLDRTTLASLDVPLLEEPALCASGADTTPGFDDVAAQLRTYGTVFDREDEAETAVADLEERLAAVEAAVASGSPGATGSGTGARERRTAAVLYPTVGGGVTYAYGNRSMADPQLEAAGFDNVFGEVDERVFEVTLEELLGRDPDVLVLLHGDGDPAAVERALTSLPGAARLTAVRNGDVLVQLFNFTEPPTPLAVDGLERIHEAFAR